LPALESEAESRGSSSSSSDDQSSVRNVRPRIDHCTWEGKLEDAENHFRECGFAGVKCSFAGCGEVVIRRDLAEHEATCQHRAERCGMCEKLTKATELAQHQLVCLKRQVDCDNHGCDARVAFDMLAHHKANDCGHEEVGCSFADMGCTARILRKDIEAHERDDSWKHNRLLLGKAKEQQQAIQQVQESRDKQQRELGELRESRDEQQKELGELKQELDEVKEAHDELKGAHEAVKRELKELKGAHEAADY
jgi:hypothetical protein